MKKQYRVWYVGGGYHGPGGAESMLMTRRQAIDYFDIFDDAVRVAKVAGWFQRTIRNRPKVRVGLYRWRWS